MQQPGAAREGRSKNKATAIYLAWGAFFILMSVTGGTRHSPPALRIAALVFGVVMLLLGLFLVFGISSFGQISYDEIFDQRVQQRVQQHYASEIVQLTSLGFSYFFTSGESFPPSRLLLFYPAVILFRLRMKGAVLALGPGGRVLIATPVLCSADGRTFGGPGVLGVRFRTRFRNGQLLVTKAFKGDCCETPEFVIQAGDRGVPETWQAHQWWLGKLDTEANPANRDRSYQAYADMAHREDEFFRMEERSES